jgi:hypothetical protein
MSGDAQRRMILHMTVSLDGFVARRYPTARLVRTSGGVRATAEAS